MPDTTRDVRVVRPGLSVGPARPTPARDSGVSDPAPGRESITVDSDTILGQLRLEVGRAGPTVLTGRHGLVRRRRRQSRRRRRTPSTLRPESESVGGVYFFFKGETVQSVSIHTARITRNFEGKESSFEHDASVEIAFETGSLWISKTDLAVPILNFEVVFVDQPSPLTDPAEGWPNTVFDRWSGEWLS